MLNTDLITDSQALLDARDVQDQPSRRTALKAALGVGYAAAALPIMAQTAVRTPADGLTAGEVTIDVNGFKMPAYRAAPAGKTGLPVVLVLSEIFGVHEYIADTARRFAKAGYLAIAPELFVRQGDAKGISDIPKLMSEVIAKVPDAQVMGDLDAAVQWAAANGGDTRKLGVTGFCWGRGAKSGCTRRTTPMSRPVWPGTGRLVGQASALSPKHPVDIAAGLNGPVLGLYGAADTGIPLDTIDKMKAALASGNAAAKASSFVVYPDAPHAFHADYRPSFRKEPAEDGWKRATAWFQQHGVA